MRTPILLLAASLAGSAQAADHEISLELGAFGTVDDRFDMFDEGNTIGTMGLRGAFAVHDRVNIVVGYHTGAWGQDVVTGDDEEYYYTYDTDGDYVEGGFLFRSAYRSHQLLLGPKADVRITDWLYPYATIQGALFAGTVRMDDDPDQDDNSNQLKGTGFSPGGVAALGIDLVPIASRRAVRAGSHLEMGYGLVATGVYKAKVSSTDQREEISRFGMGGFYMRWGVGVYF